MAGTAQNFFDIGAGKIEMAQGDALKKKAEGMRPPMEDPEMRQYLGYLQRKRTAIQTGGAYQNLYSQVGRNLANTQSGMIQASGGAAGASIMGMQRAQMGANQSFGDIVQQQSADAATWDNKFAGVLDSISKRKRDLQLMRFNQNMAEAQALRKEGHDMAYSGASGEMGNADQFGSSVMGIFGMGG